MTAAGSATATNVGQVCPPLDSGKIDTTGDPASVTVNAPAGNVITGYCVKAGSVNSGDGPEFVALNPPQKPGRHHALVRQGRVALLVLLRQGAGHDDHREGDHDDRSTAVAAA